MIDADAVSIEGGDLLAPLGTPTLHPHVVGYLSAGTVVETGPGVRRSGGRGQGRDLVRERLARQKRARARP